MTLQQKANQTLGCSCRGIAGRETDWDHHSLNRACRAVPEASCLLLVSQFKEDTEMNKELQNLPCEERQKELGLFMEGLIALFQYLKDIHKEHRVSLFTRSNMAKPRANGC